MIYRIVFPALRLFVPPCAFNSDLDRLIAMRVFRVVPLSYDTWVLTPSGRGSNLSIAPLGRTRSGVFIFSGDSAFVSPWPQPESLLIVCLNSSRKHSRAVTVCLKICGVFVSCL